uniref:Ankyrin repeat domain-containing protein 16 n=1 Tax=Timema monikensis TaxID=170555 RepID=A0A7R9EJ49_9NEOP|nr:unnamed protein product [Timema monikensis]
MSVNKLICEKFLHASNANRLEDLIKLRNTNECIHWTNYYYPSTGDTALHIASRQGNLGIVKFLVEEWTAKNCVEVCNFDSKTALHEAAQFSQPHVVKYLIKQGAEVNALKRADWTPLMLACTKVGPDALEIVNILLSNGAKPQLHNKDGWTALHLASREGDVNIVSAVLSADCSLIKLGSHNGRTPLHTAALHGQDSVVALLLKHIKDSVDIPDSCGLSPLLEAVRSGNINLVKHFINAGASLNHVDALGHSSVHLAAQTGSLSMIKFLVQECKQNVNSLSDKTGLYPLHCAARSNKVSAFELLLSLGADPAVRDAKGRSVIDIADNTHQQEIQLILKSVW